MTDKECGMQTCMYYEDADNSACTNCYYGVRTEHDKLSKKLKPCPFCGGQALLNTIPPHTHTQTDTQNRGIS